ncbi:UDP-N-acetylglucosamine 1-carboxyvinyltransferase [Aminithiophilus ramosus]|uniref:UDP-N-acetylglucosamine 1-carboxyvinyltransferase n=2 Tax=Synergistales TaxID=649776 RepID=A0A9Q7ATE3_9BACT|nr:UDP-N-acetylglucosamine 1-carboxyvinyltransferase [Aminithiophilus ramosus]QTX33591.1 UDP-N-acetylglucosamine 1-carboxyvinyltransferase [Aminithiophilus ramosus]QVL37446.1 UDP-N-acetylglucosamine 1-carboxyvinyltransferase [Synergistota bacterium]
MSDRLCVEGGVKLTGVVKAQGAKNAALPVMAAALLLQEGALSIDRVPRLEDVTIMADLLRHLGASVEHVGGRMTVKVGGDLGRYETPDVLVRKMRASSLVLGPLLARRGRAILPLPGGCSIGSRPIDLHLKGLARMGANLEIRRGAVYATAPGRLRGSRIYLDFPSVGATENLLMAAACAKGETVLENAAREPEITNLAHALVAMGASIEGAGSGTIHIQGVDGLKGGSITVIPDRVEASTFLIAGALTGGEVTVTDVVPEHMEALLSKLEEAGASLMVRESSVTVRADGPLSGVTLKTLPYPGFPTDLQPQMMVLLCLAEGTGIIHETVFESRFLHVGELKRMGAKIELQGNTSIVTGTPILNGAEVRGTDLRACAALVLAGLTARGTTVISDVHHLWRGYEAFVEKIRQIGGLISVLDDDGKASFPVETPEAFANHQ